MVMGAALAGQTAMLAASGGSLCHQAHARHHRDGEERETAENGHEDFHVAKLGEMRVNASVVLLRCARRDSFV